MTKKKGQRMSKANGATEQNTGIVSHNDDPLLSFSECGLLIGRTHTTIRRWVNDGLLKPVRDPSGLSRIRKSELEKFYGGTALAVARPIEGANNGET